jgi:Ca2+-binding RTX toxin-like protein
VAGAVVSLALPSNGIGATASVDDSFPPSFAVYVAAPGEVNALEASLSSGTATFTDLGAVITAGVGCVQVSDHEVTCSPVDDLSISVGDMNDIVTVTAGAFGDFGRARGEDGDDQLTVCATCFGQLEGNAGDDTLQGGDVINSLEGGGGADTITGGAASDLIFGGNGVDTILAAGGRDYVNPGRGNDHVEGGGGRDRLLLVSSPAPVIVDLRAGSVTGYGTKTLVDIENVVGSRFSDRLYGDEANNTLDGFGQADLLVGRGGGDTLFGGGCCRGGADRLYGGPGSDRLNGGTGRDLLVGGPDDDLLAGNRGHDRMYGGRGSDRLRAQEGFSDLVSGGRGVDAARVDRGLDIVRSIENFF